MDKHVAKHRCPSFLGMGCISLFVILGGPQLVTFSVTLGLTFKIVYCRVSNYKPFFVISGVGNLQSTRRISEFVFGLRLGKGCRPLGCINTWDLLVHTSYICATLILNTLFFTHLVPPKF